MNSQPNKIKLVRKQDDGLYARLDDSSPDVRVRLVWMRPLSGRGSYLSIVGENKKEIASLRSLDCLDPASRKIAEEEIERRYLIPRINRVVKTFVCFGRRYWDVKTDRGPRRIVMRSPNRNVIWITGDRLVLVDTAGSCYEIESLSALDSQSQAEVRKVL